MNKPPYVEKNKADYEQMTLQIRKALKTIEQNLSKYKKKPTIGDLATKASSSRGTLIDRAKKDVQKKGELKNLKNGKPNYGWPLDEFKLLQMKWKLIKKGHSVSINDSDTTLISNGSEILSLKKRVSKYMEDSTQIFYKLQKAEDKILSLTTSLHALEHENGALKSERFELVSELQKLRETSKGNNIITPCFSPREPT